jgi:ribose-phosphate pyrophosphokinase
MEKTTIFALSASRGLAEEICQELDLPLGNISVNHFADKEILVTPMEAVRGKHVYLVQSTNNPVNDNLMELMIAIDSLKRASAKSITAIIPYFGYARQDRKAAPRQPITAKLVASLIERAGADRPRKNPASRGAGKRAGGKKL